jgi:predicted transposase YbfD/YdcC
VAVDSVFELMEIRPQSERAFELGKAGLGFEQRHVELPELCGTKALVGLQNIAAASKPSPPHPRTSGSPGVGASLPSSAPPSTSPPQKKSQQLPETEIAYYVSSRTKAESSDEELLEAIVGHWDAIENGTHRVRDVSMGEDACRIAHPKAARNMVTLRNLAIGLYNRFRVEEKTQAPSLPSSRQSMMLSTAPRHILS